MSNQTTLSYLDAYCERASDPTFWAEPLNAITNLAFLWFAWKAWQLLASLQTHSFRKVGDVWALTISMAAIGIGSGLWHTHATQWSVLADVIPIYIFINIYIFSLFIRLIGLHWWLALAVWALFQSINIGFELTIPRDTLNGSIMYIPTYGLLLVATLWLKLQAQDQWKRLLAISAVFTLSLTFRTIDLMICDAIPIGSHFWWHLLNAYVLYKLIALLLPNASAPRPYKNTSPAQS